MPYRNHDGYSRQFMASSGVGETEDDPHVPHVSMPGVTETTDRGNTGIAVFVQDQTTDPLDIWFLNELSSTTLDTPAVRGSTSFTAPAGHTINQGNIIEIANTSQRFLQASVLSVVGNVITVDTPLNHNYPVGSALIISSNDMSVVGSLSSPVSFKIVPGPSQSGDIVRIIVGIQDNGAMDFSTFGSLNALTNGCVLRVKLANGDYVNLFNWKNNGQFTMRSFDHQFLTKVGGGLNSFISRSTWGGQSKRGVILRLNGSLGEELEVLVQDDLSSLSTFEMIAQGHVLQESV